MTRRPKPNVCAEPGCPNIDCQEHKREAWRDWRTDGRVRGRDKTARNKRVMYRHGRICHVCGQPGADEVDHVMPLAQGGTDDESNLRPIHSKPCHKAKTARESHPNHPAG